MNTNLLLEANSVFQSNFPQTTNFERAIFFSWGCTIGDCGFCYMSTQPDTKKPTETRRSTESILAEFILAKKLGWDIGFFTGGIGVFNPNELEDLLKQINNIINEKIWLSVGPIAEPILKRYLPFIKGVVGSTETINPELHKIVCPSKPLKPYETMFKAAKNLNLKTAMTFIVGMGETRNDICLLTNFIKNYSINKIHIYSLIPQKGTMFENHPIPSSEDQEWWIASLRIKFPKLDIQAGIWEDRVSRIADLLNAGANTISKFRATKLFGTACAIEIENQAKLAGRKFTSTLSTLPQLDWGLEIDNLKVSTDMKSKIKYKLEQYLKKMNKNIINRADSTLLQIA